jgi:hypothetical protein
MRSSMFYFMERFALEAGFIRQIYIVTYSELEMESYAAIVEYDQFPVFDQDGVHVDSKNRV